MLSAYFGHHKCASTWIWQLVADVCLEAGLRHDLYLDAQTPSGRGPLTNYRETIPREKLGASVEKNNLDFLCCITSDWAHVEALDRPFKAFHVVRDPRDIIVSAYFSHRNSHPTEGLPHLQAHRERLQAAPKDEALFLEMDFSSQEMEDLRTWNYDHPDILEVRMEELTAHPYEGFLEIFEFLERMRWESAYRMPQKVRTFLDTARNRLSRRKPWLDPLRRPISVTGDMLLGRVYDHRFEKKAGGRAKGKENKDSHYRKGVAGDWANHFTPAHVDAFKERFGNLVVRLGYEETNDWTAAPPADAALSTP